MVRQPCGRSMSTTRPRKTLIKRCTRIPSQFRTMQSLIKSAVDWVSSPKDTSPKNMCETCGSKPKFVENGYQHPFCSRTCARNGQANRPACAAPGCRAQADGTKGAYCSDAHSKEAARMRQPRSCADCRSQPRAVGQWCNSCAYNNRSKPCLREMDTKSATYKSVVEHFSREWHGNNTPKVARVIEIWRPRNAQDRFRNYRKKLEAVTSIQELRTYYGSQCICDLGVKDIAHCEWESCGICNVIKSCFSRLAFGARYDYGSKYRDGIYSYHNPALADRFATSSMSSPFRAILACDVVVDHNGLTPSRSDESINDGERVFVRNSDAIVPSYIILYTK